MAQKYIFIKHYITPAPGVNTGMKNYGKQGKKLVDERVSFGNYISPTNLVESTYIIDLEEKKVVKNRFLDNPDNPVASEDAYAHYTKEYSKEIRSVSPNFEA